MRILCKTVLIIILFILVGTPVNAQSYDSRDPNDGSDFKFGIKGGLALTNLHGFYKSKSGLGFRFGGTVDYRINAPFYIQSGLEFNYKQMDGDGTSKIDLKYIQLPLHFAYKPVLEDKVALILFAGPYFSYGVNGHVRYLRQEGSLDAFGDEMDFKRFDYGLSAGVGLQLSHVTFTISGEYGLAKLTDIENHFIKGKLQNKGLFGTVGYIF